jgi:hypothetical protein
MTTKKETTPKKKVTKKEKDGEESTEKANLNEVYIYEKQEEETLIKTIGKQLFTIAKK